MDRAPVRRTPAPPEGHGSSWPTWRGAPLSFEGPGIVLFGSMSRTGPPGASFALWNPGHPHHARGAPTHSG